MRIAVLTLTALAHDSRVLRTARALAGAGHEVALIGRPAAPAGEGFAVILLPPDPGPWTTRLGLLGRHAPARVLPASAPLLYWMEPARRAARSALEAFAPDLVVANDWATLPIAAAVKARTSARILYDSHEFASEEFADRRLWRLFGQRHVQEIERRFIGQADAVATVSQPIADLIGETYGLRQTPAVIRNVPDFLPQPLRSTGETIDVLFHGLLRPHRGLEPLISSVAHWRPEFRLLVRGYGDGAYLAALKAQAASIAPTRIAFEPAVAPGQVIEAARRADIGFFALPGSSPQSRFALPNKLFEYIAANLCVVVTPLPDMKALVEEWGCGTFCGESAQDIATAINALTRERIDGYKARSAEAAHSLNWAAEKNKLLAIVERLAQ